MVNTNLTAKCDIWNLCESNFFLQNRNNLEFAKGIKLTDCTLRDGEQQACVVFTAEDKIAIAVQLDKLGVHEIEVGTPAASETDKEAARLIAKLDLKKAKPTALARALKQDIDLLCDLGIWGANISYPIGDLQRKYKLKVSDQEYIDHALMITEYARKRGLHVNFSPYDTTRCDIDFLMKVMNLLKSSGCVDRIRMVDTVGSATPQAVAFLVKQIKSEINDIPLEVHMHNDFGLAMANTISALTAGAEVVSTTMNGVGERSGNAPTEEVALTLQMLYGIDLGINCDLFKETSDLVQQLSGVKLATNKAIVGSNCFTHESGLAVAGMKNNPFTSESYKPEIVGQKSSIVLGKKSGKASIEIILKKFELEYDESDVIELLKEVKNNSINSKSCVSEGDFLEMAKNHGLKKKITRRIECES